FPADAGSVKLPVVFRPSSWPAASGGASFGPNAAKSTPRRFAAAEPGKAVLASTWKKETDCDGRGHPDAAGGARTLPLVCGGGARARGAGGADARLPRQHPPV